MAAQLEHLELRTRGDAEVIDITEQVRSKLAKSGLRQGVACLFVPGSTGALTTIEFEPGCVADLRALFESIAPQNRSYEHEKRWGDGNGHSHVRAALLGPSLSVPFIDGQLTLGTWQQIVFVDFDVRSRTRRLVLQFVWE